MVTIDNNALIGLAANKALVEEFPFLKKVQAVKQVAPACCGKPPATVQPNTNIIKMEIGFLSPSAQARFKQLTGWYKIRVVFETGSGTQTVIF